LKKYDNGKIWRGKMFRKLPQERTLEDFKKEARSLLHGLRRWDASTVRQSFHVRLSDARYMVAQKYGCKSWRELEKRVARRRVAEFRMSST